MYRANITLPRFVESGQWTLDGFQMSDTAGNYLTLSAANLQSRGFATTVTVTSMPDTQAPAVTSLTISPLVDVSSGGRNVEIAIGISDNLSGFDLLRWLEFRMTLSSPSGGQHQFVAARDFVLVSGDSLNGVYQISRPIPAHSEPGVWSISYLRMIDTAGNEANLTASSLTALGLPATFGVADTNPDTEAPQLVSLDFIPPVFDTSAAPVDVLVTMRLTDNLAGVDFNGDHPFASYLHGISFRSPSGSQTASCCYFGGATLVSGNAANGIWTIPVHFPQYSEAGTWLASITYIKDSAQNSTFLSAADLATRGLPNQLTIFRPSQQPDATIGPGGGTVFDNVFGGRAVVTFPANALSTNTTVAIDVLTTPPPIPVPSGFGSPSLYVTITLSPTPSFPLPAPGLTVVLPLPGYVTPGRQLILYRVDPATGGVVPAVSVTGGNVVGVVQADGLSARFSGVSRLSTLVAFTPNPSTVLGDVNGDGVVNCADISIVKSSFGKRTGMALFDQRADMNRDGLVDIRDLTVVSRQLPAGTVCQ